MKKKYYRIKFRLVSSLSVGSGKNDITDRDLVRNSQEKPYIPGTALAGIYRALFSKEDAENYFGDEIFYEQEKKEQLKKPRESRVLVYDAVIASEKFRMVSRDCVALDEYKTGIPGAKFDFEILEPGVFFVTYIEQNFTQEGDLDVGEKILQNWLYGNILIGSKTTRGLGKTEIETVDYAVFDLENEADRWLDFDMYGEDGWNRLSLEDISNMGKIQENNVKLRIFLKQKGGISIRKYTTAVNEKDHEQPDYEQMAYIREKEETEEVYPVIPGTSWAGAFRHQMEKIRKGCTGDVFGCCKKGNVSGEENKKSRIFFSESEIAGAVPKQITRNAIDRFTNATVYGALYTEKTYYGGSTELEILVNRDVPEDFKNVLAMAVTDLHMGFMAVGGLTSVGRGIFEIEKIEVNGQEMDVDSGDWENLYNFLRKEIGQSGKNNME